MFASLPLNLHPQIGVLNLPRPAVLEEVLSSLHCSLSPREAANSHERVACRVTARDATHPQTPSREWPALPQASVVWYSVRWVRGMCRRSRHDGMYGVSACGWGIDSQTAASSALPQAAEVGCACRLVPVRRVGSGGGFFLFNRQLHTTYPDRGNTLPSPAPGTGSARCRNRTERVTAIGGGVQRVRYAGGQCGPIRVFPEPESEVMARCDTHACKSSVAVRLETSSWVRMEILRRQTCSSKNGAVTISAASTGRRQRKHWFCPFCYRMRSP